MDLLWLVPLPPTNALAFRLVTKAVRRVMRDAVVAEVSVVNSMDKVVVAAASPATALIFVLIVIFYFIFLES